MRAKWQDVGEKLDLVSKWAADGLSEKQIAHNLSVGYSTFREYKGKYPSLLAALKVNKEVADLEVENALYRSKEGY